MLAGTHAGPLNAPTPKTTLRAAAWGLAAFFALSSAALAQTHINHGRDVTPSTPIPGPDGTQDGFVDCATGACPAFSEGLWRGSGASGGDTGADGDGRVIDLGQLDQEFGAYEYIQFSGFLTYAESSAADEGNDRDTYRFVFPQNDPKDFFLYFLEPIGPNLGSAIVSQGVRLLFEEGASGAPVNLGSGSDVPNPGLGSCSNCWLRFAGTDPRDVTEDRPATIIDRSGSQRLNTIGDDAEDREFRVHITRRCCGNNGDSTEGGLPPNADGRYEYRFRIGRAAPNPSTSYLANAGAAIPLPPAVWGLGASLGLFAAIGAVRRRRARGKRAAATASS